MAHAAPGDLATKNVRTTGKPCREGAEPESTQDGARDTTGVARPLKYSRRRAACLAAVYLLMTLHIVHWHISGRTLAPLELNEVMYTFELGIVTAGFFFMVVAVLATTVFGRFFCSWGCHILALEDLSAWLLSKARIRPRPVRSRVLPLVPLAAMLYMFVWPQVSRLLDGRPLPILHTRTDGQGWASFMTSNFWRNLPGPWVTAFTFVTCGFAIVYLLGTRAFCAYACPYGAVFALADKLAPGRIVARGDCRRCGICTAVCQSGVRVHEEATRFGRVINPSCLKDLDCVAACPNGAIAYGIGRPPVFDLLRGQTPMRKPFDFSWTEDCLIGAMMIVSLAVFRGLYGMVPFLLTLAIGGILGYATVVCRRLVRAPHVQLTNFHLKISGGLTRSGYSFVAAALILAILTIHSAFIRYHEFVGDRRFALASARGGADEIAKADAGGALGHFQACDHWGLLRPPELLRRMSVLSLMMDRYDLAELYMRRARASAPDNAALEQTWAEVQGRIGQAAADRGDLNGAFERFAEAVRIRPDNAHFQYNLGVVLSALGRRSEAITAYRRALASDANDVQSLNNLAFILLAEENAKEAFVLLERAVRQDASFAAARFNLGRAMLDLGRVAEARPQFEAAVRLDGRFMEAVADLTNGR